MTGGFTGLENTKSTEIFEAGATVWTIVGALPRARNGLRATNVNNIIYVIGKYMLSHDYNFSSAKLFLSNPNLILHCCVGGDTEILKFEPSANNTWTVFADMTKKAGSKLEVSTINCSLGKPSILKNIFQKKCQF